MHQPFMAALLVSFVSILFVDTAAAEQYPVPIVLQQYGIPHSSRCQPQVVMTPNRFCQRCGRTHCPHCRQRAVSTRMRHTVCPPIPCPVCPPICLPPDDGGQPPPDDGGQPPPDDGALQVEIQINQTATGDDDYLTWAPTFCRARVVGAPSAAGHTPTKVRTQPRAWQRAWATRQGQHTQVTAER